MESSPNTDSSNGGTVGYGQGCKFVCVCVCVCVCVRARARTRINKQKQDYLRTVLNSPFSKLLVAISTLFINCLVF